MARKVYFSAVAGSRPKLGHTLELSPDSDLAAGCAVSVCLRRYLTSSARRSMMNQQADATINVVRHEESLAAIRRLAGNIACSQSLTARCIGGTVLTTRINRKDLATGLIFIAVGALFLQSALRSLAIGSPLNMGPGFFPIILSGMLIAIGLGTIISGINVENTSFGSWPWRGIVCVCAAPLIFAFGIRPLGMVITIFLLSLVASYASNRMTLRVALPLSLCLSAFCSLVFIYLLGLPMPILGYLFKG